MIINQVVPIEKLRKWQLKNRHYYLEKLKTIYYTSIMRLLNNRSNKSLSLGVETTMVINIVW